MTKHMSAEKECTCEAVVVIVSVGGLSKEGKSLQLEMREQGEE
jgi:hypothetical protein